MRALRLLSGDRGRLEECQRIQDVVDRIFERGKREILEREGTQKEGEGLKVSWSEMEFLLRWKLGAILKIAVCSALQWDVVLVL